MFEYMEFTSLPEVLDELGDRIIDIKAAFDKSAASQSDIDTRRLAPLLRQILPEVTASRIYSATKDLIATDNKFTFVDVVYMVGYLTSVEGLEPRVVTAAVIPEQVLERSQSVRLPALSTSYHLLKTDQTEAMDLTDIHALRRQRIRYFEARTSDYSTFPSIQSSSSKQMPRNRPKRHLASSAMIDDPGSCCNWCPEDLSTPMFKYAALGFWRKILRLKKKHIFAKFKVLDVNGIYEEPTAPSDTAILHRDLPRLMEALRLGASKEYWNQQYVRTLASSYIVPYCDSYPHCRHSSRTGVTDRSHPTHAQWLR